MAQLSSHDDTAGPEASQPMRRAGFIESLELLQPLSYRAQRWEGPVGEFPRTDRRRQPGGGGPFELRPYLGHAPLARA